LVISKIFFDEGDRYITVAIVGRFLNSHKYQTQSQLFIKVSQMVNNLTSKSSQVFVLLSDWISRQLDSQHLSWLRQKQQQIASDSSGRAFFLLIVLCLVL
jgi:hypothetical protein